MGQIALLPDRLFGDTLKDTHQFTGSLNVKYSFHSELQNTYRLFYDKPKEMI